MGGQGKTPLVAVIVELLLARGRRVAVVSRGYGRRTRGLVVVSDGSGPRVGSDEGGDEPVMLARRGPVIVAVDEDRVRASKHAFGALGADVVILDDGFQHRRLHRDLDLVVLGEPVPSVFPRGRGREPESGLARADLVVVTDPRVRIAGGISCLYARTRAIWHCAPDGSDPAPAKSLRGRRVALLSGIARPERFEATVRELGAIVTYAERLADHARWSEHGRSRFWRCARRARADIVLTTEKDAARWGPRARGMRVLRTDLAFSPEDRQQLGDALAASC